MNTNCNRLKHQLPRVRDSRIKGRVTKPDRDPVPLRIVRNLNDRATFPRVHRFVSDPGRFAIHSRIPLGEHGLLDWEGKVFKIAAIDRFEIGTLMGAEYYYEVKCLVWGRYQR